MNGEGSHTDRDRAVEVDDNVIRLTDWLGPREELVPFGPAADAEEAKRPPTADDFWSESSGAVQDALTAPHADQLHGQRSGREASAGARPPRGRATAAAIWSRRRAVLQLRTPAWDPPHLPQRLAWTRSGGLAAVVAVLICAAAAGAEILNSGTGRRPATGSTNASSAAPDRAWDIASTSARLLRPRRSTFPSRSRAHHPAAARHRTTGRRARSRHSTPVSTAMVQPVGYTTPAGNGAAYSAAAAPSTTPSSAPSTSTPAPAASTGKGSSAASQPAFGSGGSLAPGSSPDG